MTLADLQTKLDQAKRRFRGRLPESLELVAEIYLGLAGERDAKGQSLDVIGECLDMAVKNSLEMQEKPLAFRKKSR